MYIHTYIHIHIFTKLVEIRVHKYILSSCKLDEELATLKFANFPRTYGAMHQVTEVSITCV